MAVTTQTISSLSTSLFNDTDNANSAVTVKGSSGTLYYIEIDNTANGAASYSKFYDSAGAITVGTTAPDDIIKVPASGSVKIPFIGGRAFANGLQVATVTAGGTAGTTSPTSDVIVRVAYT